MNNATATIVGALILGLAVVAGGYLVSSSLDKSSARLGDIHSAIAEMAKNAQAVAKAPAPTPARRRGPDPNRKYDVEVGRAPVRGPDDAKVTIVEFSDFQCPFCAKVGPTLKKIEEEYGDKVRIAFKQLPLDFHAKAVPASKAALAAAKQGKFWEMHDLIFANQKELGTEKYSAWASELGLDVEQFKKDMASEDIQKWIDSDKLEAAKLGVTGTPSFFVNGYFLSGAQPFEAFKVAIDKQLGAS
jgi:protein-disulfide isomerase